MNARIARVGTSPRPARVSGAILVALTMGLTMLACGGGGVGSNAPSGGGTGSGSGSGSGTGNPPPAPDLSARATLVVTVVDAFGIPVPAANVQHYLASSSVFGQTSSEGTVTMDVPAGAGRVTANSILGRKEAAVDLARDARAELRLTLAPQSSGAFAVLDADVVPGSIAPDGRSVELRIVVGSGGGAPIYPHSVALGACVAREGVDLSALGPACVDRGDGTDRSWKPVGEAAVGPHQVGTAARAGPVLVLLDRSQRSGEIDRYEEHLFVAKALVAELLGSRSVAVGAFAGDGGPAGTASPLPERPVTFFPVENPGWIAERVVAFEALESLRGRVGGSSALAAAIDAGVDFLVARTVAMERPALVILTAGGSEGCSFDEAPGPNATSQCASIRAAVERARQAGVTPWLVGPGDSWYPSSTSYASPGSLISVAREAPVRWAAAPVEGDVYAASEIVRAVLSGALAFREIRFRISADEEGSFAAGVEIRGALTIVDVGWYYWSQRLPFRATVLDR